MSDPARKRVVATRPDPPAEDLAPEPSTKPPSKAQLSREEVRALLQVSAANRAPWRRVARRGGLAVLPTLVLGVVLDMLIGWWSTPVLIVIVTVWAGWPLLRQDRSGWT